MEASATTPAFFLKCSYVHYTTIRVKSQNNCLFVSIRNFTILRIKNLLLEKSQCHKPNLWQPDIAAVLPQTVHPELLFKLDEFN